MGYVVKVGSLVALRQTFFPRHGSPRRKVFIQEMGTVISVRAESDESWSVCKVMWESGTINVQFSQDLEVIND